MLYRSSFSIQGHAELRRDDGETTDDSQLGNLAESVSRKNAPRILVVDPNPLTQIATCGFLEHLGYSSSLADDGREAVEMCQRSFYDLILMDLHMPGISGLEAAVLVRNAYNGRRHDQPLVIVAYTTRAFSVDLSVLRRYRMDEVLIRPCSDETMRLCLERWKAKISGSPHRN